MNHFKIEPGQFYRIAIYCTIGGVLALWLLTPWVLALFSDPPNGTISDAFGAVNTLFTGLAFAGVVATLFLQQKELKNQGEAIRRQRFEDNFFRQLQFHAENIRGMDLSVQGGVIAHGRDCFVELQTRLLEQFENAWRTAPKTKDMILLAYAIFYRRHRPDLGAYFRSLYDLMNFVDRSDLHEEEKQFYCHRIRDQMSDCEVNILFFEGLATPGREHLNELIVRYSMLKNAYLCPFDFEFEVGSLLELEWYDERAFDGAMPSLVAQAVNV